MSLIQKVLNDLDERGLDLPKNNLSTYSPVESGPLIDDSYALSSKFKRLAYSGLLIILALFGLIMLDMVQKGKESYVAQLLPWPNALFGDKQVQPELSQQVAENMTPTSAETDSENAAPLKSADNTISPPASASLSSTTPLAASGDTSLPHTLDQTSEVQMPKLASNLLSDWAKSFRLYPTVSSKKEGVGASDDVVLIAEATDLLNKKQKDMPEEAADTPIVDNDSPTLTRSQTPISTNQKTAISPMITDIKTFLPVGQQKQSARKRTTKSSKQQTSSSIKMKRNTQTLTTIASKIAVKPQPLSLAEKADLAYYQALLAYRSGNAADYESSLRSALNHSPTHVRAKQRLVAWLTLKGEVAQAQALIDKEDNGEVSLSGWRALIAKVLVQNGDVIQADAVLQSVPVEQRTSADYFAISGYVASKLNRKMEAVDYYRKSLVVEPRNANYWLGLGVAADAVGDHATHAEAFSNSLKYGQFSKKTNDWIRLQLQKARIAMR